MFDQEKCIKEIVETLDFEFNDGKYYEEDLSNIAGEILKIVIGYL